MELWVDFLSGRDVLVFIDNDAALQGIIRGDAVHPISFDVIKAIRIFECRHSIRFWFERVASKSNLADVPSRGDMSSPLLADYKKFELKTVSFPPNNLVL